jgi:hypothetical protein
MYYTGIDPFTGRKVKVERSLSGKQRQKDILVPPAPSAHRGFPRPHR